MALPPQVSFALVVASSLAAVMPRVAPAQNISIDGRFSPSMTLSAVGGNYAITANLGKQVGSNLFHSFGKFGLDARETATFSGPATTQNVIGRVTGGVQSNINGQITSTINGANLYLINPSGIVFGPTATVNVSGSFHASTADYLKMADGTKFPVTNPDSSTLSAAAPAAFGFLNAAPAKITVNGSVLAANGSALGPGTLGLIAGPVSISGPTPTAAPRANLSAPGGTIHVTAVAGTGEVPVEPRNVSALTVTSFGPVDVRGGAVLDVSDRANRGSGGSVFIRAGALTINAGEINGDNFGSGAGGMVSLRGDSQVALSGSTRVHAVAQSAGRGADISISTTGSLAVTDSSTVSASTTGLGAGGDVSITAGTLTITSLTTSGSVISNTSGAGNAGNIAINVSGELSIVGRPPQLQFPAITALASPGSMGNAGNVTVNAGTLRLVSQGIISADTLMGSGHAGSVTVNVAGKLSIDGTAQRFATGILSRSGFATGKAGEVRVSAGSLAITNGGQISADTRGSGDGGDVAVTVIGDVVITGKSGIPARPSAITASQLGLDSLGQAGKVVLTAGGAIALSGGGQIASSTSGAGNGGSVQITAGGPLSLTDVGTGIIALAAPTARGDAGSVMVSAPQITVMSGAEISSTTSGTGAGGSVSVTTPGALVLDGAGVANTQIAASTMGSQSGPGGSVTVQAGTLTIVGGAQIATSTAGPRNGGDVNITVASDIVLPDRGPQITARSTAGGDAGSITVSAVRLLLSDGASISTEAVGERSAASGGNITLHLGDFLYLVSSEISTSVKGETGNGGDITIDPPLVILDHSRIKADAIAGHGGNITITASPFIASSDSSVEATSERGISGTVTINGLVHANGALVVLSTQLRGRTEVLREACEARADHPISSLVEAGRGGQPHDPEATLPALYIAGRDLTPNPQISPGTTEASSTPVQTTARLTMRCG